MFDELLRTLRKYEHGVRVPISIPLDQDGFFDRRCPWDECHFEFKVLFEDWKEKVPDEAAFCPFCGHGDKPQEFNTQAQQKYIQAAALAHLRQEVHRATRVDAERFNARSRPVGGLIRISMRMEASAPPVTVLVPPATLDIMTLRIVCEAFGCRFTVVGSAFFCPACGQNSADHTFGQSLTSVRASLQAIGSIQSAIPDRDAAAQISRSLIENALTSLVMAYQRYAEALYVRLPSTTGEARRNAFQNIDAGSHLWNEAGGRSYEAIVGPATMGQLRRMFQQRHLLAHREGVVDQDYVDRTGDTSYRVGQRLVVRSESVAAFADELEALASGLSADLEHLRAN
jgi:hypothetical protein